MLSTKREKRDMIYNTEQKVNETSSTNNCKDEVLFNSDTLSKITSYIPSIDLLNLALTSKRFGISSEGGEISLIEESAHIAVNEIATEEQLAALPHYEGESSLADYHYLQLIREPLTFDQLVGGVDYVNTNDKSCVMYSDNYPTAFSNNILRAGKHYVTFTSLGDSISLMVGVIRPGQANQKASGCPLFMQFYQNFSRNMGHGGEHNNIHCCMYNTVGGRCHTSGWTQTSSNRQWEGMESISSGDELGMLLDLDEGTLSVYKNGRKLGVMKRGLAGPYCWAISMRKWASVTMKRGTIPP